MYAETRCSVVISTIDLCCTYPYTLRVVADPAIWCLTVAKRAYSRFKQTANVQTGTSWLNECHYFLIILIVRTVLGRNNAVSLSVIMMKNIPGLLVLGSRRWSSLSVRESSFYIFKWIFNVNIFTILKQWKAAICLRMFPLGCGILGQRPAISFGSPVGMELTGHPFSSSCEHSAAGCLNEIAEANWSRNVEERQIEGYDYDRRTRIKQPVLSILFNLLVPTNKSFMAGHNGKENSTLRQDDEREMAEPEVKMLIHFRYRK